MSAWRIQLRWIVGAINQAASLVAYGLLCIIAGVTVLQVFLRYFLNRPTSWSEEIALLCLIWFGLLAVAIGIRRHEHVAITFFRDLLPSAAASVLDYGAQISMAVFMFVVMYYGSDLIALAGVQRLPASLLPKWWLYLPAAIGGGLGVINAITNILLRDVHFAAHSDMEAPDAG